MDLNNMIDCQSLEACAPVKISALKSAIASGLVSEDKPLALFYNLSRFKRALQQIKNAFPAHFIHTMAVKANPIHGLMKIAYEEGIGFEAASLGELTQALKYSPDPKRVVFDSPVKTKKELELSLERGVYLNLDNLQELDRVTEMINTGKYPSANIGLRINPQVGLGTIKEMSTSGAISKFGIALNDYHEQILAAYQSRPWLNGIHIHVGSQGCSMQLITKGIRTIMDLVNEINTQRGSQQITFVDIGGGFPVNFNDEHDHSFVGEEKISVESFVHLLKTNIPELFEIPPAGQPPKYTVLTEYGRYYNAKCGFIVSRVEYTKQSGGRFFATIHAGADLFVRTVWLPRQWAVRITACESTGAVIPRDQRPIVPQDIAGPCCHAGDIVAHERPLPHLTPGDYLIAHDTGAYYYSAFCYYNSRQAPPVYGFYEENVNDISVILPGQTVEDTLRIFNP